MAVSAVVPSAVVTTGEATCCTAYCCWYPAGVQPLSWSTFSLVCYIYIIMFLFFWFDLREHRYATIDCAGCKDGSCCNTECLTHRWLCNSKLLGCYWRCHTMCERRCCHCWSCEGLLLTVSCNSVSLLTISLSAAVAVAAAVAAAAAAAGLSLQC